MIAISGISNFDYLKQKNIQSGKVFPLITEKFFCDAFVQKQNSITKYSNISYCIPVSFTGIRPMNKREEEVIRVDDNYYRGGRPTIYDKQGQLDTSELKNLKEIHKIKTIIDLRGEGFEITGVAKENELAESIGLKHIPIPMSYSEPPSYRKIEQFFKILNNPDNWPVYVHCYQGKDRTGSMTALYRIDKYGWSSEKAYNEMIEMGHNPDLTTLGNFIKNYKTESDAQFKSRIKKLSVDFNKNTLNKAHINKWINQFDEEDRSTALRLAENIDYHTFSDLLGETRELHLKLSEILEKDGFDSKTLSNVDFSKMFSAKSSDMISYIYSKANLIPGEKFISFDAFKYIPPENHKDRALVLVDDYVGAGTQILLRFLAQNPENLKILQGYKKIYIATIAANESGCKKFTLLKQGKVHEIIDNACKEFKNYKNYDELEVNFNKYLPLLTKEGLNSKIELVTLNIEKPLLSDKYERLTNDEKEDIKQFLLKYNVHKFPFGFNNLQGHTGFFYNVPNSLPDILCNHRITQKSNLKPLFDRYDDTSIYPETKKSK